MIRTPVSILRGALAVILVLAAVSVRADVIEVPGDHATIEAALAAANPDDTILITDSGTYDVGVFTIDKRINLSASAGQQPLILGNVTLSPDAGGSRIGELGMGRITFRDNGEPTAPTFRISATEIPTRVENVTLKRGVANAGSVVLQFADAFDEEENRLFVDIILTFEEVEIDADGLVNYGYRPNRGSGNGSQFNFIRSKITGNIFQGVFWNSASGGGTWNFHQCDISGNLRTSIYIQEIGANSEATINITETFLTGGPNHRASMTIFGSGLAGISPIEINVDRCVFDSALGAWPIFFSAFGGGKNDNVTLNISNSDLISGGGRPVLFLMGADVATEIDVNLLNCNLLTGSFTDAIRVENIMLDPARIVADNCNFTTVFPSHDGVTIINPVTDPFEENPEDPEAAIIVPDYTDPENRIYCYQNERLLVSSPTGGPVGSFFDFSVFESCGDVTLPELGDINGDGVINVADVTELANLLVAGTPPSLEIGDVNEDGVVDEEDVQALAEMIVD